MVSSQRKETHLLNIDCRLSINHWEEVVYRKSAASGNSPFLKFCLYERSLVRGNPPPLKFWNLDISHGLTTIQ